MYCPCADAKERRRLVACSFRFAKQFKIAPGVALAQLLDARGDVSEGALRQLIADNCSVAARAPLPGVAVPALAVPVLAVPALAVPAPAVPVLAPVPSTIVASRPLVPDRANIPRPLFTSSSFSGSLSFFPCPVSSNGVSCPRGSFVHAPYCRFHLRSKLKLDVDTSTIPGAGLFSLISRPTGSRLVEYFGEVLDAKENERRYPKDTLGIYCLQVSSSCFIDSALFRGVGAVANAPPKGMRANVRFITFAPTKSARIEVVRHIHAGDEIFAGYGAEYWRHAGAPHSTVNVPDWEWDLSDPFAAPLAPVVVPVAPVVVPVAPVVSAPLL